MEQRGRSTEGGKTEGIQQLGSTERRKRGTEQSEKGQMGLSADGMSGIESVLKKVGETRNMEPAVAHRIVFESCRNSWQVFVGLIALRRASEQSSPCGLWPEVQDDCVLPINLHLAELSLRNDEMHIAGSFPREFMIFTCLGVLACWICLVTASWSSSPIAVAPNSFLNPARKLVLSRLWIAMDSFFSCPPLPFCLKDEQHFLTERRISYGGEPLSVRRPLIADLVVPVWPKIGEACVCPIIDHIDSPLREQVMDPASLLLPESEWPLETPVSKVHSTDPEWFKLVKAAHERTMFVPIPENNIFRNQFGTRLQMAAWA